MAAGRPAEHPSRYAGTLLLCAAVGEIGGARRGDHGECYTPRDVRYSARQALTALDRSLDFGCRIDRSHARA